MKNILRNITMGISVLGLLVIAAHSWAQGKYGNDFNYQKSQVGGEKILESDVGGSVMTATGKGIIPSASEEPDREKAYMKALSYARMQAIANLLVAVENKALYYGRYGTGYNALDETARQKIDDYLKYLKVVKEETVTYGNDRMVKVTVSTRMPANSPSVSAPADVPVQSGPFSSLIVDARGCGLSTAMSPKIRKADGSEVWGTISVSDDYAIENGIVGYAKSLEDAQKSSRCGKNPLIVKAVSTGGAKCDPVVSDADAARIQAENTKSKFADKCNVIFVID